MNIHSIISKKIQQVLTLMRIVNDCKIQLRQSSKTKFGDYQITGIITTSKQLGMHPYTLAKQIVSLIDLKELAYKIDIAGPGFINIFLNPRWLEKKIQNLLSSPRLGVMKVKSQNIVIDYSSPNICKEMHVGHMRSTIIGDALARTLKFLGHNVIKANHIGDWGTQFGMLIAYLETIEDNQEIKNKLSNLENFYCSAKIKYDKDPIFAKKARDYVVKLQNGDIYCKKMWSKLVNITMMQNQKIYERLNVTLKHKDIMGESLYNDMLPEIVSDLKTRGLAVESEGAVVVFLEEFKNKKGDPMGVVIQKKDGAYLYTTTDIACVKYRYEQLKADRIIYYTDSRQNQHLMQVWIIARKAGYIPKSVSLEHHMFGMMLRDNGKPFKTRSGETIKLTELLDEALERAYNLISVKNNSMNSIELKRIAHIVSIGAVKYADLSKNRTTNYIFNWDNMLSFEGNTAPYIQYAYTRIASIFRRYDQNKQQFMFNIRLETEKEIMLATNLLQLEEAVIKMTKNGMPHILCAYLYNLAVLFSAFYESCPILHAETEELRQSRLQLSLLTARTLKQGLNLLGIGTIEKM